MNAILEDIREHHSRTINDMLTPLRKELARLEKDRLHHLEGGLSLLAQAAAYKCLHIREAIRILELSHDRIVSGTWIDHNLSIEPPKNTNHTMNAAFKALHEQLARLETDDRVYRLRGAIPLADAAAYQCEEIRSALRVLVASLAATPTEPSTTRKPHEERVIAEKKELDAKREKLGAFIGGDMFRSLSYGEQSRLEQQLDVMTTYSRILGARIEAFTP